MELDANFPHVIRNLHVTVQCNRQHAYGSPTSLHQHQSSSLPSFRAPPLFPINPHNTNNVLNANLINLIITQLIFCKFFVLFTCTVASRYKNPVYKNILSIRLLGPVPTDFVCKTRINFLVGYSCRTANFCVEILIKSSNVYYLVSIVRVKTLQH